MSNNEKPLRVCWLYEKSHLKQPFIKQALETMAAAGHKVTLINMLNTTLKGESYDHVSLQKTAKGAFERMLLRQYGAYKPGLLMPLVMAWHANRIKPDVVMASIPLGLVAAWLIKKKLGSRLVYYPMELYGEQKSSSSSLLRKLERRIIRDVDALVTQNESRGKVYVEERNLASRPYVVHNYKKIAAKRPAKGALRELLGIDPDTRIVLYEGMITPGRWIERVIRSVAHLPENVSLVLLGKQDKRDGWWEEVIEPALDAGGARGRVHFVPWVKPHKLPKFVVDADAGVIIYDDSIRNHLYCEPGKLSDYVLAGVPVVAPPYETIAPVVERLGVGAVFKSGSPEDIAQAVKNVLDTPRKDIEIRLEEACKDLAWATQEASLLMAVDGTRNNFPT